MLPSVCKFTNECKICEYLTMVHVLPFLCRQWTKIEISLRCLSYLSLLMAN